MHVPDGFIDVPVSAATGVVAAGAVAVALRGARRELDERTAPLAGLVAAFVFAAQMLNFPVAAGTSGHLLGGALAAVLVGPYTGVLCVSVVLLMQGILFADGGLTALGVNITDMAVVTTVVSYALFRGLVRVLPRTRRSVTVSSFVAALVSVPASALAFTLIYAVGGTTDLPIGKVLTAMVGVHVLIGVGEAAITALTVGAVIAVRPDLVYGARGLTAPLKLRVGGPRGELVDVAPAPTGASSAAATVTGSGPLTASGGPAGARSNRTVWVTGLVTALVLAGFVSFYASASPDGLEKVAADQGIDKKAEPHHAADSPLADYGVRDVADARLSGGLAGAIGVGATVVVGSGVFWAVRRRRTSAAGAVARAASATGTGGPGGSGGSGGFGGAGGSGDSGDSGAGRADVTGRAVPGERG
ncbi:energy-coupling factor ABC transporter permease [Streptomyces sp. NPDC004749]